MPSIAALSPMDALRFNFRTLVSPRFRRFARPTGRHACRARGRASAGLAAVLGAAVPSARLARARRAARRVRRRSPPATLRCRTRWRRTVHDAPPSSAASFSRALVGWLVLYLCRGRGATLAHRAGGGPDGAALRGGARVCALAHGASRCQSIASLVSPCRARRRLNASPASTSSRHRAGAHRRSRRDACSPRRARRGSGLRLLPDAFEHPSPASSSRPTMPDGRGCASPVRSARRTGRDRARGTLLGEEKRARRGWFRRAAAAQYRCGSVDACPRRTARVGKCGGELRSRADSSDRSSRESPRQVRHRRGGGVRAPPRAPACGRPRDSARTLRATRLGVACDRQVGRRIAHLASRRACDGPRRRDDPR